jgi:hypothetical protein
MHVCNVRDLNTQTDIGSRQVKDRLAHFGVVSNAAHRDDSRDGTGSRGATRHHWPVTILSLWSETIASKENAGAAAPAQRPVCYCACHATESPTTLAYFCASSNFAMRSAWSTRQQVAWWVSESAP